MNRTSVTTPISSRVDDILNADTTTAAVDQILGREFQGTTMNVEDPGTLSHYGVLGMKWGVRKDRRKTGSSRGSKTSSKKQSTKTRVKAVIADAKKNSAKKKKAKEAAKRAKITDPRKMTEAELKQRIERLELEKKYKDLSNAQISKGKRELASLAGDIMKSSVKNIGTQLTTYGLGTLVNKAFANATGDEKIVNPKKGQKDK